MRLKSSITVHVIVLRYQHILWYNKNAAISGSAASILIFLNCPPWVQQDKSPLTDINEVDKLLETPLSI